MPRVPGIRVIAGSARGRRLKLVPGAGTRPVSDRVKEALFSILGADVQGARFLDLFGGTGGVGIEALSRGAVRAVFVDDDRRAADTIQANLKTTGFEGKAQVVRSDVFKYLARIPQEGFDYVYVAPPQYQGLWSQTVRALDARPQWVNPDGWVIVQIHPTEDVDVAMAEFARFDQRKYGSTALVFYERVDDGGST